MGDMSLTSSGQTKVLSFEEFTASQAGGMIPPTNEPAVEPEQVSQEIPIEEPGTGAEQDDITMVDGPESGSDTPEETPAEIPAETTEPVEPETPAK